MKKYIVILLALFVLALSQIACDDSAVGVTVGPTSCSPPQQLYCLYNPDTGTTNCTCINPPQ